MLPKFPTATPGASMKAITPAKNNFITFGVPFGKNTGTIMKNVSIRKKTISTAIKYTVLIKITTSYNT
jgi:hypothetical protein